MNGLVKVGFTMKDPEIRANELNHTGTPHPYIVEYEALVDNPRDVEQSIHRILSSHREGKEWFYCTPELAVAAVKTVLGDSALLENYKRVDRERAEATRQQELADSASNKAREAQEAACRACQKAKESAKAAVDCAEKSALAAAAGVDASTRAANAAKFAREQSIKAVDFQDWAIHASKQATIAAAQAVENSKKWWGSNGY